MILLKTIYRLVIHNWMVTNRKTISLTIQTWRNWSASHLLPIGRGRASIPWTPLKEQKNRVAFLLDEGVDTWDIIHQEILTVLERNAESLQGES